MTTSSDDRLNLAGWPCDCKNITSHAEQTWFRVLPHGGVTEAESVDRGRVLQATRGTLNTHIYMPVHVAGVFTKCVHLHASACHGRVHQVCTFTRLCLSRVCSPSVYIYTPVHVAGVFTKCVHLHASACRGRVHQVCTFTRLCLSRACSPSVYINTPVHVAGVFTKCVHLHASACHGRVHQVCTSLNSQIPQSWTVGLCHHHSPQYLHSRLCRCDVCLPDQR